MTNIIIVMAVSFVIAIILNKVTEKTNLKEKCEELVDDKSFVKWTPLVFIVLYFVIIKFVVPGLGLGAISAIITQIICITAAVYTFELFNM